MNENCYSEHDWQALHEEIQKRFRTLAAQVPATAVPPRFGKTVTKLFPLFSHMSFSPTSVVGRDDIIVGVDIAPKDGQWRIDADVCEEESGTIFFELPNAPFSVSSFQELTDQVLRTVDQLTAGAKPVLIRLLGSAAAVMPGQVATAPNLTNKI
jgi:hypothetical protein